MGGQRHRWHDPRDDARWRRWLPSPAMDGASRSDDLLTHHLPHGPPPRLPELDNRPQTSRSGSDTSCPSHERPTPAPAPPHQPARMTVLAPHCRGVGGPGRRADRRFARFMLLTLGCITRCLIGAGDLHRPPGRFPGGQAEQSRLTGGLSCCASDVCGDDVRRVPVQGRPGPVITHGGSQISVRSRFLHIAQRHPSVHGRGCRGRFGTQNGLIWIGSANHHPTSCLRQIGG